MKIEITGYKERVTQEKDLGVVIDTGGKQAAAGKANRILGCIRRGIIYKKRWC